jgi:hypothetical protein
VISRQFERGQLDVFRALGAGGAVFIGIQIDLGDLALLHQGVDAVLTDIEGVYLSIVRLRWTTCGFGTVSHPLAGGVPKDADLRPGQPILARDGLAKLGGIRPALFDWHFGWCHIFSPMKSRRKILLNEMES